MILQKQKANEIIQFLSEQEFTKSCKLHGSLGRVKYDHFSDIDLQLDVSGYDNGKILLMLPYIIGKEFPIVYTAFAPKFAPDLYLVSFAFLNYDIFHFIDIECIATPHNSSVTKDEIVKVTDFTGLYVKLLIGCLKKHLRGQKFPPELNFIANQLKLEIINDQKILLLQCFKELEKRSLGEMNNLVINCIERASDV